MKSIQQEGLGQLILFGAAQLQSPLLGFTPASNQAEQMGRRSCNPAASMLLLLLILLLFSLCQAQGVTHARQAPQAYHGAGGVQDGWQRLVLLQSHPKSMNGGQGPTWSQLGGASISCSPHEQRTQSGAGSGGISQAGFLAKPRLQTSQEISEVSL